MLIGPRIIKTNFVPSLTPYCAAHISEPLCHIINLSIGKWYRTECVESCQSNTDFRFKSGNHELPENYRPVSVLPVLSKILEKAVHRQFIDFLESNNLLSESQFGFRKRRSTKLAATLHCDDIRSEMNKGNFVGVVYLDLSTTQQTFCVRCEG